MVPLPFGADKILPATGYANHTKTIPPISKR